MKKLALLLLPFIIAIFIFFIPFSWLKPGEMDLGGDNSRLYFYDPIAYMASQSLYSISHSGLGGENLSYYAIPFFLLLALVKSFLRSPTLLISVFHGLNMSLGFISCYWIVKELLKREQGKREAIVETSGILAGLFYTFSPVPIGWWTYPLLSMNQIFLNPLLFFLMLRFFLTGAMRYMYLALLITFVFSPNFSFVGAPTFFAFFPLAGLFLFFYTRMVAKKPIPVAKLIVGLVLFLFLQAFHLISQVASILTPGSVANQTVFGEFGKLDWGLKYFLGTASIIKVSNSLLNAPQFGKAQFYAPFYIVFPALFVLGLFWNKSRLYLLSAIFFLITFFFVTANITNIGFRLYSLAFHVPGFSMFRVFYGQWQWAYQFFYTLLTGLALATVLPRFTATRRYVLTGLTIVLLLITSWPLINGTLTDTTHWQSKGIRSRVKMDPLYEEVLSYIRKLPVDGKIITFPLSGPGYQVLKGENDAAYEGPSTITYLAARNEFNGFQEFGPFGPRLLTSARQRNYKEFKDILAILNIKYIFYNEDPFIYTDNYPGLPYEYVQDFFPDTQDGYKEFIRGLGAKEVKSFGWKYHIYEIDDTEYLPHIYVGKRATYWSDIVAANPHTPFSLYTDDKRLALYEDIEIFQKYPDMFDEVFLKATNKSTIHDFFKQKKLDKFVSPTVSRTFTSLIYPLVVLREQRDLGRFSVVSDEYIARSIYFSEKRINELYKFKDIPRLGNVHSITELVRTWEAPKLWEFARYKEYNSWEITLARYQKAMEKLISELDAPNQSNYSITVNKVELKTYLVAHNDKLREAVRQDGSIAQDDKRYLLSLIDRMFADIYSKLNLTLPDTHMIPYGVGEGVDEGIYEVYVRHDDIKNVSADVSVHGETLREKPSDNDEWIKLEDIKIATKSSLALTLSVGTIPNLVERTGWKTAEQTTLGVFEDQATLAISHNDLPDISGLFRDISGWEGDTVYVVSFDYLTFDQYFSMAIREKGGKRANRYDKELYRETFKSSEWKTFNTAVLSSKDAKSALLQIMRAQDDTDGNGTVKQIMIKNLTVQKVYDPKIIFKKVITTRERSIPSITFTQINPTKYKITVRDALDPYVLVFSQLFHPKWKLFFPDGENEAKTVRGAFSRFLGGLFGQAVSGFRAHAFLNADTFETWGIDPTSEATHLPINGYANSWYIKPSDVQNRSNYTLTIEMTSQKLFYGSLFASVVVFFFVLTLFLFFRP